MEISTIAQAYPTTAYHSPYPPSSSTSASQEIEEPRNRHIPSGEAPDGIGGQALTEEEQKEVEELRERDREVRAHEQAHLAAAGQYAVGGPTFEYQTGPDNKRYAVGGEVRLDTSEVPDDPEATMRKMEQIRRAALAPRDPSPQDRRVAAEASQKEVRARREMMDEKADEVQSRRNDSPTSQVITGHYFGSTNSLSDDQLVDVLV